MSKIPQTMNILVALLKLTFFYQRGSLLNHFEVRTLFAWFPIAFERQLNPDLAELILFL